MAEMTGRKARIVRHRQGDQPQYEHRDAGDTTGFLESLNVREVSCSRLHLNVHMETSVYFSLYLTEESEGKNIFENIYLFKRHRMQKNFEKLMDQSLKKKLKRQVSSLKTHNKNLTRSAVDFSASALIYL